MPDISSTIETAYADGKILKHAASGVGVITFNNPDKRNAMSLEMWEGFGEALTALRDDETGLHGEAQTQVRGALNLNLRSGRLNPRAIALR